MIGSSVHLSTWMMLGALRGDNQRTSAARSQNANENWEKPGKLFRRIIFDYINLKKKRSWFSMYFAATGFYGRLLRSEDVKYLTYAIALYYRYKPVDWIFYDVEYSRYCSPERNSTTCGKVKGLRMTAASKVQFTVKWEWFIPL
ncbi:hypothetical protein TELCIR_13960 [Teladorsagia circumcincta]|uniref:Uncharacterized protein n=1 Tax=Teladorsagia circumcincta TaxID=45464 RepID=A0A2G9U2B9_TELCI|nr:hypothetical protein TELCIR_13960 [Teladorsagia circumcincta]